MDHYKHFQQCSLLFFSLSLKQIIESFENNLRCTDKIMDTSQPLFFIKKGVRKIKYPQAVCLFYLSQPRLSLGFCVGI